jgi:hypothetical protein
MKSPGIYAGQPITPEMNPKDPEQLLEVLSNVINAAYNKLRAVSGNRRRSAEVASASGNPGVGQHSGRRAASLCGSSSRVSSGPSRRCDEESVRQSQENVEPRARAVP